jgi:sulfur transfer protein SufE
MKINLFGLWITVENSVTILIMQHKVKSFEVPGCQSQTWLVPHFVKDDKIYFTADSAALDIKGHG